MLHRLRRFRLCQLPSIHEASCWFFRYQGIPLDAAFEIPGEGTKASLRLYNDSTGHRDGFSEWAVFRKEADETYRQVDSITLDWMGSHEVRDRLEALARGAGHPLEDAVEPPSVKAFSVWCRICSVRSIASVEDSTTVPGWLAVETPLGRIGVCSERCRTGVQRGVPFLPSDASGVCL